MAISRVGSGKNSGIVTTVTIPAGHQADDFMVVYGFSGSAQPVPPSGWVSFTSATTGINNRYTGAYKWATSSSETSGTWTNISIGCLIAVVYRGVDRNDPIGTISGNTSSTGNPNWPAITLENGDNTSWVVAGATVRAGDVDLNTPPAPLVNVQNDGNQYVVHDTDGTVSTSFPSTTESGISTNWGTDVWELKASDGATYDQEAYRWRNDDGSETTATWAANENTSMTAPANATRRLRIQLDTTSGDPRSQGYKLQWRKQGDPDTEWRDIS